MPNALKNKTILITGGAGSIGSAIAKDLLKYEPKAVRVFDIHEFSLYRFGQDHAHDEQEKLRFILGDIRDIDRLKRAMEGVDIVYHAAAYKHVPLCEYNPLEAVKTNVLGTQNVVDAAIHCGVDKVVFISTDKAARPAGTLGASKLLGEKIITAANYYRGGARPLFSSVRFGNVTMSTGSVIPSFLKQIRSGGPVKVTSPEMTRFFMPMHEAVNLIFKATEIMQGGEVFVFKMRSMKIADLAEALIQEHKADVAIKYTGIRNGENIHEQLLTEQESGNAIATKDLLILLSSVQPPYQKAKRTLAARAKKIDPSDYVSNRNLLTNRQIREFIRENDILGTST